MSISFADSSNDAISAFFSETRFRSLLNSFSSPDAFAAPTIFEAVLRSAKAASALVILALLSRSISKITLEIASAPRRFKAASNLFGSSRIVRISCIENLILFSALCTKNVVRLRGK